ncbi:HAD-IA family hydrolase [Schaalia sp. Marseille-Q2122]|uniref:HAD-IA family hydrolase n=1 Tax=Schaalia sp. Marseille-Q2122 TaxID=2736604 RepID=UPI0015895B69|nr:HAD-IA family hydrolase [Schaalia sp. Marseille-Q2122]
MTTVRKQAQVRALIFDCDGVLADTERDGHRVAFNAAFSEAGLPIHWDAGFYGELVTIGGGKERIGHVLTPELLRASGKKGDHEGAASARPSSARPSSAKPASAGAVTSSDPAASALDRDTLIRSLHARKSRIFQNLVAEGKVPPRPGVARLIDEALAVGWHVAVASTSAQASVEAVLRTVVGVEVAEQIPVFAGDIVPRKKPAPDIYLHALNALGIAPEHAIAVEDSGVGARAALAAGMSLLVTVAGYTREDDFSGARLVVDSLGEANAPALVLSDPYQLMAGRDMVDMGVIAAIHALAQQQE